jgi:hypothetical protein
MKYVMVALLLFAISLPAAGMQTLAQDSVTSTITVYQGIQSQVLKIGIHPLATHGIDLFLGESELPPLPPSGTFDVRLVDPTGRTGLGQGSRKDYVPSSDTSVVPIEHQIQVQRATDTGITITWSLPDTVSGYLRDLFGGVLVNEFMQGSGSTIVANVSVNDFLVLYDPTDLPVELTSLTARQDGRDVVLSWTTLSESQNTGFEVHEIGNTGDATDLDDSQVHVLGFVPGAGTSRETRHYAFRIPDTSPGLRRFRLKQIDASGLSTYSSAIEIRVIAPGFGISDVYPNPVSGGSVRAQVFGDHVTSATVCIIEILGRKSGCQTVFVDGGAAFVDLVADGLAPGLYFVQARTDRGQIARSSFLRR